MTPTRLGLTLAALCALGAAASRPAQAQDLTCTLTNVTFDDGAVATGSFEFNPTTHAFSVLDVVTTNGLTDSLTGADYNGSSAGASDYANYDFIFSTHGNPSNYLLLNPHTSITSAGVYALNPGTDVTPSSFGGSGEFAPSGVGARGVTAGLLAVTGGGAPVPESSSLASLTGLLALGLGGVAVSALRRKKAR